MNDGLIQKVLDMNNSRLISYNNRIWQIPFVYLAIITLPISFLNGAKPIVLALSLLFAGLLGIVVTGLLLALKNSEKRTIQNINNILKNENLENYEHLDANKDSWYITFLTAIIILSVVTLLISAGLILCNTYYIALL